MFPVNITQLYWNMAIYASVIYVHVYTGTLDLHTYCPPIYILVPWDWKLIARPIYFGTMILLTYFSINSIGAVWAMTC